MEELLKIENVSKSFSLKGGKTLQVLADVNLTIENTPDRPQMMSVLGPTGSGKTTLLRILTGLDKPDSGTVSFNNGEVRKVCIGDIGVALQESPLFDDRTVLQNLIKPAKQGGLSSEQAQDKALKLMEEFDLLEFSNLYPSQLSRQQRQRVAIAQQLTQNRRYIILDEPFFGLDPNHISYTINLLKTLVNKYTKNTFITFTHDISSALMVSDKICLLGKPNNSDEKNGAYIVKEYDLFEEGLAYRNRIEDLPRFQTIRKEIKNVYFPSLVIAKN